MENEALIGILEKEIETRILPNKNYPYVPASAVRSRLNEAFGARWNTHILSSEVINDENVLVLLELTCFVGEDKIVKEGFGSAPIHRYSSGINKGKPVNLGDAYGNALMDAVKATAKQLGVGNREMDVKKDPRTGKYVRVDGVESSTLDNVIPITKKQETPKIEVSNEKINELKKKLEANKNKTTVTEPKPELKEPVVEKEDDVPMPESSPVVPEETTDKVDAPQDKLNELRKKLEANKKKAEPVAPKPEPVVEKPVDVPAEENTDSATEYGFDYGDVGGTDDEGPKNTQKLVILNLARMQKLTVEDYIKKALGKDKTIDELSADEAGRVVRSGLSKFD